MYDATVKPEQMSFISYHGEGAAEEDKLLCNQMIRSDGQRLLVKDQNPHSNNRWNKS